jgi:predicted nucleic acid-binding protein
VSAASWFANNDEPLISTDYVVDETLTLLQARGQKRKALEVGSLFFTGRIARIHYLRPDEILRSWRVFEQFFDKSWSFTDCTSKVVMESLGITRAFSFDQHFRQFGSVIVLPTNS